jgi:hypothetical protein
MQQAHRTGRHHGGPPGPNETIPFDQQALKRAARNEPFDSTLPGVSVDPSLPLILSTPRQRLTLKQPSEFDPRPVRQDRVLGRILVAFTIAAITVIVFAAAPSLDVRSWLHAGSPADEVASPPAHAPSTTTKAVSEIASASALSPVETPAQATVRLNEGSSARVGEPRPASKVARKPLQTNTARATKRTKRKARLSRSAN